MESCSNEVPSFVTHVCIRFTLYLDPTGSPFRSSCNLFVAFFCSFWDSLLDSNPRSVDLVVV